MTRIKFIPLDGAAGISRCGNIAFVNGDLDGMRTGTR